MCATKYYLPPRSKTTSLLPHFAPVFTISLALTTQETPMTFRSFLTALILCLLSTSLFARPGTIRTKDGRTIEGDITDKGTEGAVISTRAGQITIRADEIAEIQYGSNIKEAYEKRLAALPKDAGARAHVDLARWLYENKEYELARKELDTALTLDPNNEDATVLRQTVDRTMLLDKRPGTTAAPRQPAAGTGATGAAAPNKSVGGALVKERHLLSAEQINTIKQAELRNDEQRVRVRLENNVAKKYVESANMDPREFAAMPDASKAFNILKYGAPELRKDVKIVTDPQALIEFKAKVQPALLQSCATSACHGGTTAGRFLLYNPADNDSVSYTNFYTLTQLTSNIDGTQRRMIDRLYPQNSLILQFALPRDRAEFDHPEAAGWKALFSGTNDNRYFLLQDWVKNALVPIQPNYGIDFVLPTTKAPATQPTQPAAPADQKPPAPADQKPPAKQGA
jgi:tetratricopeptide (TPR) repeat protein